MWYHHVKDVPEGKIYLSRDHPKYRKMFTSFKNYDELYNYIKTLQDPQHLYEYIRGPRKPYFDLDISAKDDHERILSDVMEKLSSIIKINLNRDVLIYSSHDENKKGYHIVIDNYYVNNHLQTKWLAKQINIKYVDLAVYSSAQQFRLLGSSKIGTNRIKKFMNKWKYKGEIITYYTNPDTYTMLKSSLVSLIDGCELLDVPNIDVDNKIIYSEDEDILKILYNYLHDIPFKIRHRKGNVIVLDRIKPSYCNICKRIHEHENGYVIVIDDEQIWYSCRRGKGIMLYNNFLVLNEDNGDKFNEYTIKVIN
jgi:hypothetical protein